ncbi:MAG: hypothetical protein ACREXY_23865 [Gammaproteobacteria bacterium]
MSDDVDGVEPSVRRLARTLGGHIYHTEKVNDQVQVGRLVEGMFSSHTPHLRTYRRSDVPCPYCRSVMLEAVDAGPLRIVRILKRRDDTSALVIGCPPPTPVRVFGCKECQALFTLPVAANRDGGCGNEV